jgi:hypothetical protein
MTFTLEFKRLSSRAEWLEFATGLFHGDMDRGREFLKALDAILEEYTIEVVKPVAERTLFNRRGARLAEEESDE